MTYLLCVMFGSSSSRISCLHSARRLLSLRCVSRPILVAINHRWPRVLFGQPPTPHCCWIHSADRHDVEKEQPMSYYKRTVTFSSSLYKLYQDFLLYQNITSAYQTACTGHHSWAQRYHSLLDTSRRFRRHTCIDNDIHEIESAVALIVQPQQQQQQRKTYAPNLRIPYRAQEQQYHYRQAIQKVTPVVLFCMIPIVGYLPMLLAILLPRQLLSHHFYNQYEILYYNEQQYQQRKTYYSRVTLPPDLQQYIKEKLYQHQPSPPTNAMTTTTTTDDIMALYRFCCASMDLDDDDDSRTSPKDHDTTASTTTIAKHTTPMKARRAHLLQLQSYSRDSLVPLALATGIYSSMITNRTLQYIITAYGTPTFLLRYYLHATVQQILQNDQLLLCEEYLASTGPLLASFVQCQMTHVELSHAAQLRGLPPTPTEHVGPWLTEHLTIVALLLRYTHEQNKLPSSSAQDHFSTITDQDLEQIGLFLLHLPVIRHMMHTDQLTKR